MRIPIDTLKTGKAIPVFACRLRAQRLKKNAPRQPAKKA
jgi:hypothetical protein